MPKSFRQKSNPCSLKAENLIAHLLRSQGWIIRDRRVRNIGYELDLVAEKQGTLIVIEVKARKSLPGDGRFWEELLSPSKKAALCRGLASYLATTDKTYRCARIDLAVVIGDGLRPHIHYFPGAVESEAI